MAAGFGFDFGHLGDHNALATWAELRALQAAPFHLLAECIYSTFVGDFKQVSGHCIDGSGRRTRLRWDFSLKLYRL